MDGEVNLSGTPDIGVYQSSPVHQKAEEEDIINLLALSTISESTAMKLALTLGIDAPSLKDVNLIKHAINLKMSQIGSSLWDKYLETLAKIRDEIKRYEESPQFRAKQDAKNPLIVWEDVVSATESYVKEARDKGGRDAPFMVASLVVTTGQSLNVVNTVSSGSMSIKPIIDATQDVTPMMGKELRDYFNLTINLFVTGMMNYANIEAISAALNRGAQAPVTKDTVLAFAHNVINKVTGNEVNVFLMALLINKMEKGNRVTNERVNQLANMAKAVMIAIALAALYHVESGWITEEELTDLLAGKMAGRSVEETQLVQLFKQSISGLSEIDKAVLMSSLTRYISDHGRSVGELIDPTKAYAKYAGVLVTPQQRG